MENDSDFSSISLDFVIGEGREVVHSVIYGFAIRSEFSNEKFYESGFSYPRFSDDDREISWEEIEIQFFE